MHRILRTVRPFLRNGQRQSAIRNTPLPQSTRRTFWSSSSSASATVDLAANSIPAVDHSVLPVLFGLLVANALEEEDESQLHTPPWKVVSIKGKGFGAIAEKNLEKGERLIAERPIAIWPTKLNAEGAKELFDQMTEREKSVYMSLAPVVAKDSNLDEILSRRAANGFSIAIPPVQGYSGSTTVSMMFPKISRINHSCTPNASQVMNFNTLRMEVYATTPVPSGSEVTIEYIPGLVTSTKAEREAALYESFGFERCLCQVCSASPAEIARSDSRRREIKTLSEDIKGGGDRQAALAKLDRIRTLLAEEGFKGLPSFSDPNVSSAYTVFVSLRARAEREGKA